ncbi:MAG: ABC transporter substrate-binding protein, partial [Ilumatobacteraceae bacterium]
MSDHLEFGWRQRSGSVWKSFFAVVALAASVGLGGSQSFAAGSSKVEPIPIAGQTCSKKGDFSTNGLFCERTKGLNKWTNPVLKPGTYKIGYPAVITGAQALVGISEARGVRLAVEEINRTKFLGAGVKLELVETDTGGDSGKVIGAISEFSVKRVSGIVCCLLSAMSGVAKPIVMGKKLPMVIPTSLLPSLPQLPYVYRPQIMLGKPGGTYAQLITELVKSYKLKKVVIVQTADSAAVAGESLVWQASAQQAGLSVLAMVNTLIADTDYSGAASQVIAKNPDAVFVSMNSGS